MELFNEGYSFSPQDTMGEVEVTLSAVLTIVLLGKVTCFDIGPLKYDNLQPLFGFGGFRPTNSTVSGNGKTSGRRKQKDEHRLATCTNIITFEI